jgi:predicted alpha/beta hydrolase family esterase
MKRFLILHGTDGSPNANWFMWLKGVLIGMGYQVWLPQLPDADKPDAKKYTEFLLANKSFAYDEETILVGHSSGAVEVLHLLQNLPEGSKIKDVVFEDYFVTIELVE